MKTMKTNITHVRNEASILFGSKIVISEGLRPKRIVLREEPKKFVVTLEYMDASVEELLPNEYGSSSVRHALVFEHSCFDQGNYFDFNEVNGVTRALAKELAEKCFMERSLKL
jgi:predicted metal-binding protein